MTDQDLEYRVWQAHDGNLGAELDHFDRRIVPGKWYVVEVLRDPSGEISEELVTAGPFDLKHQAERWTRKRHYVEKEARRIGLTVATRSEPGNEPTRYRFGVPPSDRPGDQGYFALTQATTVDGIDAAVDLLEQHEETLRL